MTSTIIETIFNEKKNIVFFNTKLVNLSPLKNIYEQKLVTNVDQFLNELHNNNLQDYRDIKKRFFYLNDDLILWKKLFKIR